MKTALELAGEIAKRAGKGAPLRIAFDLDDVLSAYQSEEDAFFGRNPGAYLSDCHDEVFCDLPPDHSAVPVVSRLALQHELIVISARESSYQSVTEGWLDKQYPASFAAALCIGGWAHKLTCCRDIGADVMVDNRFYHVYGANEFGVLGVHLDVNLPEAKTVPSAVRDDVLVISRHAHLEELLPVAEAV